MSKVELDAAIAAAAAKAVADAKDSIFAEARRTFTATNKSKPGKSDDGTSGAPAALTSTEERTYLRGLDRTIAQLGIKPNTAQYARAERDLLNDRPDNVDGWAKDYFEGWGAGTQTQPTAPVVVPTQAQPPKPTNERPASDRGSPPPSQVPLVEQDLVSMSESDRRALIKEKGNGWYVKQLQQQLKGRRVTFGS